MADGVVRVHIVVVVAVAVLVLVLVPAVQVLGIVVWRVVAALGLVVRVGAKHSGQDVDGTANGVSRYCLTGLVDVEVPPVRARQGAGVQRLRFVLVTMSAVRCWRSWRGRPGWSAGLNCEFKWPTSLAVLDARRDCWRPGKVRKLRKL